MTESTTFGKLTVEIHPDAAALSLAAAKRSGDRIRTAIERRGSARIILATGNSQLDFLMHLREAQGIDWSKVDLFHLDEYMGLPADHPSSFRHYLHENFVDHVKLRNFHGMGGDANPQAEAKRYASLLAEDSIDLSCLGVGNNGHLAFNDPPFADFNDPEAVKPVVLDEVSRQQQVSGGLFAELSDVPTHALTLTIPRLLDAGHVQVLASGSHKAEAIRTALTGPVSEDCPASVLQLTAQARLYLDSAAASLLR